MGYTTEFEGTILIDPPLNEQEIAYLTKFADTRRMHRVKGPYFVDGSGPSGQGHDADIISYNGSGDQPGLWCQWIPTECGRGITWDGNEKFYDAPQWMQYLIDHFIGDNPIAKSELPFLQGHKCNGVINAEGEERSDVWDLIVIDNKATAINCNNTSPCKCTELPPLDEPC